jgi:hypothetical protein
MPAYTNKSRVSLLAMAGPLAAAAQRQRAEPAVLEAALAVEHAARALALELGGRRAAGQRLSAEAAQAHAIEASIDRRIAALHRTLDGLAGLGFGEAEALSDVLFPEGLSALIVPKGRAQVPGYRMLAATLAERRASPAAERLEPAISALHDDLVAFCEALATKDEAHDDRRSTAARAAEAAEALQRALLTLDRTIELLTGGPRSEAYLDWAAAARGLG